MTVRARTRPFRAAAATAALTGAAALLLAGAGPAPTASAAVVAPDKGATKQVPIAKDAYSPAALTVKLGDTVVWKNLDARPHTVTVTSGPQKFDSGVFAQGKSYAHTFTEPGTYDYYCTVHPDMAGTVAVTKDGKAPAKPAADEHTDHPDGVVDLLGPFLPGAAGSGGSISTPAESDPVESVLTPFEQHMVSAHYTRTAGQQVEDLLEVDSYAKSHTALLRMMLDPAVGKSSAAATSPGTGPFLKHMDSSHWNRSPGEQINDISVADRWVSNHVALLQRMVGGGHAH